MLEYKGYVARLEPDPDADILHGEVVNTRDVITFQGQSVAEARRAFQESVDDYLAFCAERGEEPERPFSGQFLLRSTPEIHRLIYAAAKVNQSSLNAWAVGVLAERAKQELEAE